jgi:uncharacterized protein (TIGR03067 family)
VKTREGGQTVLVTFQREAAGKDKPADKPTGDQDLIQGVWQITDFEVKGKGPDEAELKKIKAAEWVFKADRVVVRTPGENDSTASCKLDPSKKPKEIDFIPLDGPSKDTPQPAIYSLEGDVLKICAPGPEGGPRPKDFAAQEGGKTVLFTLKRQPDKDKGK